MLNATRKIVFSASSAILLATLSQAGHANVKPGFNYESIETQAQMNSSRMGPWAYPEQMLTTVAKKEPETQTDAMAFDGERPHVQTIEEQARLWYSPPVLGD
jgi:hypothetical protein